MFSGLEHSLILLTSDSMVSDGMGVNLKFLMEKVKGYC